MLCCVCTKHCVFVVVHDSVVDCIERRCGHPAAYLLHFVLWHCVFFIVLCVMFCCVLCFVVCELNNVEMLYS